MSLHDVPPAKSMCPLATVSLLPDWEDLGWTEESPAAPRIPVEGRHLQQRTAPGDHDVGNGQHGMRQQESEELPRQAATAVVALFGELALPDPAGSASDTRIRLQLAARDAQPRRRRARHPRLVPLR